MLQAIQPVAISLPSPTLSHKAKKVIKKHNVCNFIEKGRAVPTAHDGKVLTISTQPAELSPTSRLSYTPHLMNAAVDLSVSRGSV